MKTIIRNYEATNQNFDRFIKVGPEKSDKPTLKFFINRATKSYLPPWDENNSNSIDPNNHRNSGAPIYTELGQIGPFEDMSSAIDAANEWLTS
jgi:hypothetical protein